MNLNLIKRRVAAVFDVLRINQLGLFVQKATQFPFIRAVNYHDVSADLAGNFESHLQYYSSQFANVDEQTLRGFLNGEAWPHKKPGMIISFDDGMRSHFEIVAPLLEKYGFTGWFFVPSGWIAERIDENPEVEKNVGDQLTLNTEQTKYLAQNHVVGCHTETHRRLSSDLSDELLRDEIVGGKHSLEKTLGRDVPIFCWVGGEEFTYSRAAAEFIGQNYDLSFMTNTANIRPDNDPLQLQRTNIEAENPLSLVRFQLSGFMDLAYLPKRRRVNKLTAVTS
jgi:peptidoglycan/xylan/chitin deacetylase (PgdA/CDA1 family)